MSKSSQPNEHRFRESWLHAALTELRPLFSKVDLKIPEKVRCSCSLTSAGTKGARKSECWPASASGDDHCEIFISPDIAEPVEVLSHFCHALVHACLPADAGHGPAFKGAATSIGLVEGKMRHAMPGRILLETLGQIAANLGPLPHAKLDLTKRILDRGEERPRAADAAKPQKARMFKIECPKCREENGHNIARMSRQTFRDYGALHCGKHGVAMEMEAKAFENDPPAVNAAPEPLKPAPIIIVAPPPVDPTPKPPEMPALSIVTPPPPPSPLPPVQPAAGSV